MFVQEDSVKTGKVTSAGMFFLGFPVYRFEQNNSVSMQAIVWLPLYVFVFGASLPALVTARLLLQRILIVHSLKDWMAFNHVK